MPRHYHVEDLTGQEFGRWTAIRRERTPNGEWAWLCRCQCGTEKHQKASRLRSGVSLSCGCMRNEMTTVRNITHGRSKTLAHRIWCVMKTRCVNPNATGYENYGGRGIKVCERWQSFENFLADMGEPPSSKHSIDRIDVNSDYCPENCRWATDTEQARNKRSNRTLEFRGETRTVSEWSESLGIAYQTILHRLRAGWSVDDALGKSPDGWANRRTQYGESGHRAPYSRPSKADG